MSTSNPQVEAKRGTFRRIIVPLLTLLLVASLIVGVFYFYQSYPDRVAQLQEYGYLGVFLISLIFNATIVLPAGNILLLATLGATLPSPFLVGIAGGAGAAIGELTGYAAGYSGRTIVKRERLYTRVEAWVDKWGSLTIFLVSIVPFIFDLVGIAAGVLRIPLWKFLIACWLGRTILYIFIALASAWGWEILLRYLG